jgi:hypothetical protein
MSAPARDEPAAAAPPVRACASAPLWRSLLALGLFGVSFAYVEAAVVVYLRALYEPLHHRLHPDRGPDDLFPVIRLDQLAAEGPAMRRRLDIELVRELATLVMLAAVGLAVGRGRRDTFSAFLVAFGVWDIAFYAFLKILIDWPATFWTWDLLFLLPLPWTAPVIAPMIVALSMIVSGVTVLAFEAAGRPLRLSPLEWAAVVLGGLILVVAFCWDHRNIIAGGLPQPFHWPLFWTGEAIGVGGFLCGLRRAWPRRCVPEFSDGSVPSPEPSATTHSGMV